MRVLVLGATGMLGQAIMRYCKDASIFVKGLARSNADYNIDLEINTSVLEPILKYEDFDVIINTIAIVDLAHCEAYPEKAYRINTHLAGEIAKLSESLNTYYVQISTDHYYNCDTNIQSNEKAKVSLLNEYAKTKYLGEQLVGIHRDTLIVRTNIVGFRGNSTKTFVEWAIHEFEFKKTINGFTNMFTSSIDVKTFVTLLFLLVNDRKTGTYNIGSKDSISKYEFLLNLAKLFQVENLVKPALLIDSSVRRAKTLGLDIKKFQKEYPLSNIPTSLQVIENIYTEYEERKNNL